MNRWWTRNLASRSYVGTGALCGTTLAIALLILATGTFTVVAQDATPAATASRLADLGYPEMRLVATDDGAEAPREVAAGRYLVVLENRVTPGGLAAYSDVQFIQLPTGVTLDDLNKAFANQDAPIPDWFGEIDSAGGIDVAAGETGYAGLDLEPGEWYVGVGDTNPFTPLTVTRGTAATPVTTSDPAADVTVELRDFAVDLPDQIPAGRRVWHSTNVGHQPHFLTLVKTADLLTVAQVQALASLPEGGTPPPGAPDPATVEVLPVEVRNLSPGREIWVELDLAPGFYAALCFITDPATGMPHVQLGEVDVFTVS